jgi:glycosyltransferase involved in cell wall biosynthesis
MKVSLIVTIKNEAKSINTLLDSIAAQTRPPDEVVICDGGSTDSTLDLLRSEKRFPLRVIEKPNSNISQGRNAAIEAATGDVIASTDAGVHLDSKWLEKLVGQDAVVGQVVGQDGILSRARQDTILSYTIVSGFFLPDPRTPFEVAMGATVLPQLDEIDPKQFLPSSRSIAFTKEAWRSVNGYPEWLDFCEDLVFDFSLLKKYKSFAFAPEAIAYFRPRSSLRAFIKQYYQYARGDGKANLWLQRHLIRYATYLIAVPLIAWLSLSVSAWFWLLSLSGAIAYLKRPYQRLSSWLPKLRSSDRFKAIAWIPIIRVAGDIAKMIGYPVGVVWRRKYRHNVVASEAKQSH